MDLHERDEKFATRAAIRRRAKERGIPLTEEQLGAAVEAVGAQAVVIGSDRGPATARGPRTPALTKRKKMRRTAKASRKRNR